MSWWGSPVLLGLFLLALCFLTPHREGKAQAPDPSSFPIPYRPQPTFVPPQFDRFFSLGSDLDEVINLFSENAWVPEIVTTLDLQANTLTVDGDTQRIEAIGNARLNLGQLVIQAGTIILDQQANLFLARDWVEIRKLDQPHFHIRAQQLNIDSSIGALTAQRLGILMKNRQLTAHSMAYVRDDILIFEALSYTSCPIVTDPEGAVLEALWSMDVERVLVDEFRQTIIADKFAMRVRGLKIPIALNFILPDLRTKRLSGLTNLSLGSSTGGTGIPRVAPEIFIDLGPSQDLTFTPWLDFNRLSQIQLTPHFHYRAELDRGDLDAKLGIFSQTNFIPGTDVNYDISGSLDLSPSTRLGMSLTRGTTLMSLGTLSNPLRRSHHVYTEIFSDEKHNLFDSPFLDQFQERYGIVEMMQAGRLDDFALSGKDQLILPNIFFENISEPDDNNVFIKTINRARISRSENFQNLIRIQTLQEAHWRGLIGHHGIVSQIMAGINNVIDIVDPIGAQSPLPPPTPDSHESQTLNLKFGLYSAATVALPLMAQVGNDLHILEPRIGLFLAPTKTQTFNLMSTAPPQDRSLSSQIHGWIPPAQDNVIGVMSYEQLFSPHAQNVLDRGGGSARIVLGMSYSGLFDANPHASDTPPDSLEPSGGYGIHFSVGGSFVLGSLTNRETHNLTELLDAPQSNPSYGLLDRHHLLHLMIGLDLGTNSSIDLTLQNAIPAADFASDTNLARGLDLALQAELFSTENASFSAYYADSPLHSRQLLERRLTAIPPENISPLIPSVNRIPNNLRRLGLRARIGIGPHWSIEGQIELGLRNSIDLYTTRVNLLYRDECLKADIGLERTSLPNYPANNWTIHYGLALIL